MEWSQKSSAIKWYLGRDLHEVKEWATQPSGEEHCSFGVDGRWTAPGVVTEQQESQGDWRAVSQGDSSRREAKKQEKDLVRP